MFDRTIATRALTVCALAALLTGTAACGGSDKESGGTPSSTRAPSVTEAVSSTYQRFFNGSTTADQKIALLENGQAFAATIKAQAGSAMAKSTTATVSNVASSGTDHADVTFTILFDGKPALAGQSGTAVRTDGAWKVTAATFCALLTLEGNPPPVCATPAPTPTS
ncbi:hypothetical protein [Nocardia macrotermitis]|uniref:Low molecular weight antigen MTB12-like C-terminal domain-containing protein n=1 Tax=Nocardia macrotermitis TaxID=2585198 RepID=A0A7K0D2H0_9NOCA|nr:hypothetical protein [Nocardia macrotermitis]MQY19916.1 hypothetical protein [Nocardia macrotermitis]